MGVGACTPHCACVFAGFAHHGGGGDASRRAPPAGSGVAWHLLPCRRCACCARFPGLRHPLAIIAWHLFVCHGCCRRCASLACLVATRCGSRSAGQLSCGHDAFLYRGLCAPGFTQGLREPRRGQPRTGLLVPATGPRRSGGIGLALCCTRSGPCCGVVPGGSLWLRSRAACAAVAACADPVTHASGFPCRPLFNGVVGKCTGAVSFGRRHLHFWVGGRHARVPRVCMCARSSWPGRAGRPRGRILVHFTFPVTVLLALFVCTAPSGLGALFLIFFLFFSSPFCFSAPPVLRLSVVSGLGALDLGAVWLRPPPLFFSFLFFVFLRPRCLRLSVVLRPLVPWALAPCGCPPPPTPPFCFFLFFLCLVLLAVPPFCCFSV